MIKKSFILLVLFSLIVGKTYTITPSIRWYYDIKDMSFGNSATADIDGDGKLEIVFSTYRNDGFVYALNGEDGTLLWKFDAGGCCDAGLLIYDVNRDNKLEIIVPGSCVAKTFCLEGATGKLLWSVETRGSDSPPTIADIDDDGVLEILHGEFGGYVICIDGKNGLVKWEIEVDNNSWIQTEPIILDLDKDGNLDFVVANWSFNENHKIFAYRGIDQKLLWVSDIPDGYIYHGAGFADIDGDDFYEIIFGSYDGFVYSINGEDGSLLWAFSFPEKYYVGAPVSIADLNKDGFYEIVFVSWYKVGVLNKNGKLLWEYSIPNYKTSFRGASISDINGDGLLDVIFGTSGGEVIALKGYDGSLIWSIVLKQHFGRDTFEIDHHILIDDFDGDDFIDLFTVGGYAEYPNVEKNYGRAYMLSANLKGGPAWRMFRRDERRSACIPSETSSVDESKGNSSFVMYPNPVEDVLLIQLKSDFGIKLIEVFDIYGKLVFRNSYNNINRTEIKLENISQGIYLILINNKYRNFFIKN